VIRLVDVFVDGLRVQTKAGSGLEVVVARRRVRNAGKSAA
jgi:hypothetical protein